MERIPFTTWEETRARFQLDVPETFNFGRDVVDDWAETKPDALCLIWQNDHGADLRYTWAEMRRLTNQFANALTSAGVGKGDRVIIMLPRIPEWQIAMVACFKMGAIPIPCIEMLTEKDIAYRAQHAGATAAVTVGRSAHKFAEIDGLTARFAVGGADGWSDFGAAIAEQSEAFEADDTGGEDPVALYYTSGSTGLPKGVTFAARGLFVWRISGWYWQDFREDDLVWCTADTGWSKAGTGILIAPWSCGACVYFYDGAFDPSDRLRRITDNKVTVFCAAATEFRRLVQEELRPDAFGHLRLTATAGESVNPDTVTAWQAATGSPLVESYGQTETLMTIANHAELEPRSGSMGKPLPGTKVAILDPTHAALPTGEIGELALELPTPGLMLGYWNDPERTAATFAESNGQRYFLTGDQARVDAEGYVYYEGRTDDIISSAGYRIGPMEVENALVSHPAIVEAAAVAAPDPDRGEIVKAYIVLSSGYEPDPMLAADIQDHVKQQTAPYKYPRAIAFVDELPKTATGKVLRRALKARAQAEADNAGA
ncbi:MAG: AMP-binding protein [Pseudomonadota bacterium]